MSKIYEEALARERVENNLSNEDIEESLKKIRDTYNNLRRRRCLPLINYNQSGFRCAYIHYFTGCHTSSLLHELSRFSEVQERKYTEMMMYRKSSLTVCSLGGGPGCDLVGLLYARYLSGYVTGLTSKIYCTVVDLYAGWKESLNHVRQSFLNNIGSAYQKMEVFQFNLLEANLCSFPLKPEVTSTIKQANIVTMVKFVSIIPSKKRQNVECLKRVFTFVKKNAFVVYLDNLYGSFFDTIITVADLCGMNIVWKSENYRSPKKENPELSSSCLKIKQLKYTAIDVIVWQKA